MSDVVIKRLGASALVTLNRPKALNALNRGMIDTMYSEYQKLLKEGVKMIVLEGAGEKAFCAGGDVRAIWEDRTGAVGRDFFHREYNLNYLIGSLQIPHVALIHGFTMGGGVGVSLHGKYRVATEKTVFSMPECAIGLFPDVGASHFLPRLQGELGLFLGLTGHRLKGYDTVAAGIATHYLPSERLGELKDALLSKGVDALDEMCERHSNQPVEELCANVDKYFKEGSVEEIVAALKKDESNEWAQQQVKVLGRLSPTSLKITLHLLRNAPKDDRRACFENEFSLGSRVLQKPDFFEGVRAVLVDKDNSPKWTPESLDQVDVDFYFKRDPNEKLLSFL